VYAMQLKELLDEFAKRPMNRREFLWHAGAAVVAMIGISGLLKSLHSKHPGVGSASDAYGSSAYGGDAGRRRS
jgi:hypothetical protein